MQGGAELCESEQALVCRGPGDSVVVFLVWVVELWLLGREEAVFQRRALRSCCVIEGFCGLPGWLRTSCWASCKVSCILEAGLQARPSLLFPLQFRPSASIAPSPPCARLWKERAGVT